MFMKLFGGVVLNVDHTHAEQSREEVDNSLGVGAGIGREDAGTRAASAQFACV
eukprot:m.181662 g.181662  ORF g.181662 m.181662 type:complete len:53 (+) comp24605_c0_seq2:1740-1898(+)